MQYQTNRLYRIGLVGYRMNGLRLRFEVWHCSQPSSVLLWPSAPHRPLTRPLPCSTGVHFGSSWWLETEDWSSQTILAENGGGWPATNEPCTGDVEAACSGQISMAETRDNGYVYNKLLKKKKKYGVRYSPLVWCIGCIHNQKSDQSNLPKFIHNQIQICSEASEKNLTSGTDF